MLLNCGVGEDSWESLGLQGDQTSQSKRKSSLDINCKDWCWNFNTLATWCKELTHRKRPWCWEILRARGEGSYRGWDVWMPSLTQWTWVWTNSRRKWRTGKPGMLQSMGLQRVGYNIATEQQYELDFYNFNKCTFQVQTSQLRVNTLKTISIRLGQGYYPLHSHPRTSYQTARCIPFSTEMTQTWQSYICISCLSFSYPQKSQ